MRIARADQAILRHHDERVGAADLRQRVDDRGLRAVLARAREQMHDHFGVGRGLEDRPAPHQRVPQLAGIDDVAVVPDSQLPVHAVDDDRLRVGQAALARRRVPHVPHRHVSRQLRERLAVEDVVHIAHRLRDADLRAVGRGNAGALLPAVLKRVEPEVGEIRRLGMSNDSEDAALIAEFVDHQQTLASACSSGNGSTALEVLLDAPSTRPAPPRRAVRPTRARPRRRCEYDLPRRFRSARLAASRPRPSTAARPTRSGLTDTTTREADSPKSVATSRHSADAGRHRRHRRQRRTTSRSSTQPS